MSGNRIYKNKSNLVGSKKRKYSSSGGTVYRNIADTPDDMVSMTFPTSLISTGIQCPVDKGKKDSPSVPMLMSESDSIGGKSDNDFIATYVEVGEEAVSYGDESGTTIAQEDSECFGTNDMSTSEFCSPSTSTSSTCTSSVPTADGLQFNNYSSEAEQNQLQSQNLVDSKSDCEDPAVVWARLFDSSSSILDLKLSSFSQLLSPLSYHLLLTRTVKSTVYDTSSCEDESEAQTQVFEVGVNDYKLTSKSLVRIHPLLLYNRENPCSVTPIRCFLPAKKSSKSQIYTISRNSSEPEVVQVQLEIEPPLLPLPSSVSTFEVESSEDLTPVSVSTVIQGHLETLNVHESVIIPEISTQPIYTPSDIGVLEMSSFGPHKLKSSDAFRFVNSSQIVSSQNCVTSSAPPPPPQRIAQPQLVQYNDASQSTMNIIHMPSGFSSNQLISSPAATTYIIPSSSLNRHPGSQTHCGGGQVLLSPGQQPIGVLSMRTSTSGVIVNQNSPTLLQDNPQNPSMPQIQPSPVKLVPEKKQITVSITNDNKYILNGSPNAASTGGSVQLQIAGDVTNDKEKSRPGFVSTCHNCGTQSVDFHCCHSCHRVIPRGSRILPDTQYRKPSNARQVESNSNPVAPNAKKGKAAPTIRGGGGVMSKRVSRKKVQQQEVVVLSSDEEEQEQCDPSPEKKAKLSSDTPDGSSSLSSQPTPSNSQEIPLDSTLRSSNIHDDSLSKLNVVSTSVPISHGISNSSGRGDDLNRVKEEIKHIITSGDPATFVQMQCRSFRVGTHKVIMDSTETDYFNADICEKGVMFSMPHVIQAFKKVHLVIPHNSILTVTCHAEHSSRLFLLFRIGNKIAKWVRDTLGMKQENKDRCWFDPHVGKSTEQNIVFMLQSINEEQVSIIKGIYRKNLSLLNSEDANQLLCNVSGQLTQNGQENMGSIIFKSGDCDSKSTSLFNSIVADPLIKRVENKGDADGPSSKVSSTNPGGDKFPIKSQESKAVSSDKSSVTTSNLGVDTKKTGPISRAQAEKDKVKNGKLAIAAKSLNPVANMEPISDGSRQIIKWPKGQLGITLHQADLLTLRSEQFLNDQILDFWLLYVHNKLLGDVDRNRTHVFSTFFYNRLTTKPKRKSCPAWEFDKNLPQAEKRHRRVKKWTKNVDIFSKDYIIVPINDNCHWYVAIICYPGLDGPHWVDDGTPIEGWTNLAVDKGKPKYNLPPGMVKRDDDKPPKKKKRRDYSKLLEDYPLMGNMNLTSDSALGASVTPTTTPTKESNGVLPASDGLKVQKDDMDGNAPFPGLNPNPSTSASEKPLATKPAEDKQAFDSPNKNQQSRTTHTTDVPTAKPKPCDKPVQQILDSLYPEIDPYKDEADDDPDEEALFQEYYFSDSDTSDGGPGAGSGLDASQKDSEGKEKKLVSSPTKGKDAAEPPAAEDQPNAALNKLQPQANMQECEDQAGKKINAQVKAEPEPMDVDDVNPKVEQSEDKKNVRTDFRVKQPCILLFNSLSGSPRSRVFVTLREYLRLEYRERKGKQRTFTKFEMPGFEPNVPQQKNMCDCGIYVLQYVEHFFSQPFPSLLLALPSSLRNWFPQLVNKRKEMYDTIVDLVKSDCPANLRLLPQFELPPLPTPTKGEKSESQSPAALSQNQSPALPVLAKPELPSSLPEANIPATAGSVSKNSNVLPTTQASPVAVAGKKFVIPKLSGNKTEKKVKPVKKDVVAANPKKLSKSDSKGDVPKSSNGSKKVVATKQANISKTSEVAKTDDGVKSSEDCQQSELATQSEPANVSTELPLSSEGTTPNINMTLATTAATDPAIPDTPSTNLNSKVVTEEIPLSSVVSAPTLKIVPVIPSEEPMDIDV